MADIRVLEKQVAEFIAAGEVVDRPASVVKELVENSIDAGATALTVEIQKGGIAFLRVTDNGCGIPSSQVPTAFLRHATSKIHTQEDLEQIGTLGFRGEALASIATVSRVEMLTCLQGEIAGTRYVIAGGEEQAYEEAGCPPGTTIVVRDLFYNTPARMKFLKSDMTEAKAVAGVLDHIALSHPEISIRFLKDGKEELHTPGDNRLKSAIYAVYGKEFTAGLLPVQYELDHITVQGFVSKPSAARPNRSMQMFFINGRCVKSRTAAAAVEQAVKGSIMVGKFPACVLHIGVSCQAVDVNVHPAKLEVRFFQEKPIFDAIYHGVKTALQTGDTPKPLVFPKEETAPIPVLRQEKLFSGSARPVLSDEKKETSFFVKQTEELPIALPAASPVARKPSAWTLQDSGNERPRQPKPPVEAVSAKETGTAKEEAPAPAQEWLAGRPCRVIGEVFDTYILVELDGENLWLVDKHAAHERLLYEKIKGQKEGEEAQLLLEPIPVTLDKTEYAAVLESLDIFSQAGLELEDFGGGTVLVRSAPLSLEGADISGAVMEMAGHLAQSKTDVTAEHIDWLYHNMACRAAVKAGDRLDTLELAALVQELQEHPEVRYCPHGRPIYIAVKRKDLEKQFGRI